jgi:hypothetical protein
MSENEHNIESFNALGRDEQLRIARIIAEKSETIDKDDYRIDLYSYCDFFLEVTFRKELNIIKSIKGIDALEYADKYIELEDFDNY